MDTHFNPTKHWDGDPASLVYNPVIDHHVPVPQDDGEPIRFKWHFARGLLSPRMSGYELAEFIVLHMFAICSHNLFAGHPRIHAEFLAMLLKLTGCTATGLKWLMRIRVAVKDSSFRQDRGLNYDEISQLLLQLVNANRAAIDELLPWIRVDWHQEDSDIVYLSLNEKTPQPAGRSIFA
jgi:hypothetical protein